MQWGRGISCTTVKNGRETDTLPSCDVDGPRPILKLCRPQHTRRKRTSSTGRFFGILIVREPPGQVGRPPIEFGGVYGTFYVPQHPTWEGNASIRGQMDKRPD